MHGVLIRSAIAAVLLASTSLVASAQQKELSARPQVLSVGPSGGAGFQVLGKPSAPAVAALKPVRADAGKPATPAAKPSDDDDDDDAPATFKVLTPVAAKPIPAGASATPVKAADGGPALKPPITVVKPLAEDDDDDDEDDEPSRPAQARPEIAGANAAHRPSDPVVTATMPPRSAPGASPAPHRHEQRRRP